MSNTVRFGVSINDDLLCKFDNLIDQRSYANRSEAIRDLIRKELVKREWAKNEEVVGVITLLYDHHQRNLSGNLTRLQHHQHDLIISTTHIHLDGDNCLELLAVKGKGKEVEHLASHLIGTKGVKHGELTATSTGKKID